MNNKYCIHILLIYVLFVSIQIGDGRMQFMGAQHKERSTECIGFPDNSGGVVEDGESMNIFAYLKYLLTNLQT